MTEKNYSKYNTYKYAFGQINKAIEAGFFLEAITIEESIITDRLIRFCINCGYKGNVKRTTLGNVKSWIGRLSMDILTSEKIDFLPELDQFWVNRNECLHEIAKSEPGEPTKDFTYYLEIAKATAIAGKKLTRKVSNWADDYRKRVVK